MIALQPVHCRRQRMAIQGRRAEQLAAIPGCPPPGHQGVHQRLRELVVNTEAPKTIGIATADVIGGEGSMGDRA
ncbi:hypothetical protein ACRAWF_43760 [Streptomyces sp. L7]